MSEDFDIWRLIGQWEDNDHSGGDVLDPPPTGLRSEAKSPDEKEDSSSDRQRPRKGRVLAVQKALQDQMICHMRMFPGRGRG